MSDQAKLQKMLEVLLLFDSRQGRSIQDISDRFSISPRTVYRYIDTYRRAGFVISRNRGRFRISKTNSVHKDISKLLHFSEEESLILSKAIHMIDDNSGFKNNLVKKLYALYDFDQVIHAITKKEQVDIVYNLLQAMKKQKAVILKKYKSSRGNNIRDRIVEPFGFTPNYVSSWCFDLEDQKNKIFNTARIGQVALLEKDWNNTHKHRLGKVDVFRVSSFDPIPVKIKMSLRACNLLTEEYPLSEKHIHKKNDSEYLLSTEVSGFEGIGRFLLGLIDEVEVLEPAILKDFLNGKIRNKQF